MTIEQYFEALKAHHKGKTPYGFGTAESMHSLFNFAEKFIKEQGLTVEQYLFICNNIHKFKTIKTIHGIEYFEQWKLMKNI
jgi:hypothetical protein